MQPFVRVDAIAAPLPIDNVDTDAIIPSRETQSVARDGYADKLFANWRYVPGTRAPRADFVLNRAPFDKAGILVAGRNFGCGSSREAAVWALQQFGIRSVIAGSFGSIFRDNCIRNGVAPVVLPEGVVETLLSGLATSADPRLVVDLVAKVVRTPEGAAFGFELRERERTMLLEGADEIALTLQRRDRIEAFRAADRNLRPWVYRGCPPAPEETAP